MNVCSSYLNVRQRIVHDSQVDGVSTDMVVVDPSPGSGLQEGSAEADVPSSLDGEKKEGLSVTDDRVNATILDPRTETGDRLGEPIKVSRLQSFHGSLEQKQRRKLKCEKSRSF